MFTLLPTNGQTAGKNHTSKVPYADRTGSRKDGDVGFHRKSAKNTKKLIAAISNIVAVFVPL